MRRSTPSDRPLALRPVLALADRLRSSARLGTLSAALLVPAVVATVSYAGVIGGQIDFATAERAGVTVVEPALTALVDVATGQPADLGPLRDAVHAHPELHLANSLTAVEDAPTTPRTPLATALAGLITEAGNTSNLILDPDLDSFYVMDLEIVQLPKALLTAVKATEPTAAEPAKATEPTAAEPAKAAGPAAAEPAKAAGPAAAAGPAGAGAGAGTVERAIDAGGLSAAADAVTSDIDTATRNTAAKGLPARLGAASTAAVAVKAVATALTSTAPTTSTAPAGTAPAGGATSSAGTAGLSPVRSAVEPTSRALDDLLAARIGRLSQARLVRLTVTVAGLLVAIWFAAAVWWRTRTDVRMAVTGVTAIAAGELDEKPLPAGRDEFGDIGRALATARLRLAAQDRELTSAREVREKQTNASFAHQRDSERQLRRRAQNIIDETAEVIAAELGDVVNQVNEVRTTAGTIDERVHAADTATSAVVERAREADRVVSAVETSLRRVAAMADLIAGIAGQTRLLALNATIEAERAGEYGRGFSVVANEVKELATTTTQSTDQIVETIASLERDTAEMAGAISAMVAGISTVDDATAVLRGVANDQQAVVARLDERVGQTLDRIGKLSEVTQQLERRHAERISASGTVLVRTDGSSRGQPAELVDLSSGGLRCRPGPGLVLEPGHPVEIELVLGDERLALTAQPLHVDSRGEVGMQFLSPDPATVTRVQQHLTGILERSSAG